MFDHPRPAPGTHAAQGCAPGVCAVGGAGQAVGAGSGPEASAGGIPADEVGFDRWVESVGVGGS
ncbi:MAG: hypothetical protein WCI74_20895, partial [Actinomycetes bacterium]